MIRLVFTLRRQSHLSRSDFQEYWLNQHAPLVASVATDLNILRYVQTHTMDDPANKAMQKVRGEMEPEYDGVAELWWSTEAELEAAMASEAGQAAGAMLLADEEKFINLPNSPLWFAYEYPQVNPTPEHLLARKNSSLARVFFPLRQQSHLSDAQARHYWLTQHGPIVRAGATAAGMLRYQQVHRADTPLNEALRASRNTAVDSYLGHAEVWIDRSKAPDTTEARAAGRSFVEDEFNFIDMARSTIWLGKEHSVIDRRLS